MQSLATGSRKHFLTQVKTVSPHNQVYKPLCVTVPKNRYTVNFNPLTLGRIPESLRNCVNKEFFVTSAPWSVIDQQAIHPELNGATYRWEEELTLTGSTSIIPFGRKGGQKSLNLGGEAGRKVCITWPTKEVSLCNRNCVHCPLIFIEEIRLGVGLFKTGLTT
jgi:hypothetical protein